MRSAAISGEYDADQFTIATGVSEYDVLAGRGPDGANKLWVNGTGEYVFLQFDENISIKINATTNASIFCYADRGQINLTELVREVDNFYITNDSGNTVTIDVVMA
jgi:hypothetical protein